MDNHISSSTGNTVEHREEGCDTVMQADGHGRDTVAIKEDVKNGENDVSEDFKVWDAKLKKNQVRYLHKNKSGFAC